MKRQYKMQRGESIQTHCIKFNDEPPVISVTGTGRLSYIWVGGKNGPCYATLSGVKTLKALRTAITKALSH
jgi:hypothetical protein